MIGLKLLIMKNRREFIKKSGLTILATTLSPQLTFGSRKNVKITILHTNDMHSHIEPFKRGRNKGLGGMAKRATIINEIRNKEKMSYYLMLETFFKEPHILTILVEK